MKAKSVVFLLSALVIVGPAMADQAILDDLVVNGSSCIGFDCVNGESFGFDTLRFKENNLRIKFQDTSSASFPSNDWQITINDSAGGGLNHFSIDDIDGGGTPFRLIAGAPTNSFHVSSSGFVGIGTGTPATKFHLVHDNSPSIRLEQTSALGFAAQTYDLVANESGFMLRDVTNGFALPVRVLPGAPTNSFVIDPAGVGMGTDTPSGALHVFSSANYADTSAQVTIENDAGAAYTDLLKLVHDGPVRVVYEDGSAITIVARYDSGFVTWAPGVGADSTIDFDTSLGDITILGDLDANTVNTASSRALKRAIHPVDAAALLAKVSALVITHWIYKADGDDTPHIGPMAEDFYAAFGVGADNEHLGLSDVIGIALASVQALHQNLLSQTQRIERLEQRNEELAEQNAGLEARLARLEKLVSAAR